MTTSDRRRRTGRARRLGLVAGACLVAGGCGNSLPSTVSNAPVLHVVTAVYPLAQAASLIGQGKATIADVVPDGANPLQYQLTPAQESQVRSAGLAVGIAGGFQPSFSGAAGATPARALLPPAAGNPYLWLDPATMGRVVTVLAAAMEAADRPAAALFRRNASSLQAQIASLGIDYSSTLSTCPDTTLITPDGAFATMAAAYGLRDLVVEARTAPTQLAAARAALTAGRTRAVVGEPWVDDSGVEALAASTHVALRQVDTLAGAPAGGWPSGANYFSLMEQDLGTLSGVLGCSSPSQ